MPTVGIAFGQTDLYSALCVKSGVVQMGRVIAHCVSTSAFAFLLHTTPWSLFTPTYPHTLILSVHSSQDPGHDRGSGPQLLSCGSVADSGVLPSWSWKPTRGDKHVCVVVDKMLGAFQLCMMFFISAAPAIKQRPLTCQSPKLLSGTVSQPSVYCWWSHTDRHPPRGSRWVTGLSLFI